jgi:hypothetical protein
MNADILRSLLTPVDSQNDDIKNRWEEFLKTVDENILWYPSAGNDLNDLSFRFSGLLQQDVCPSAIIHTDYFADEYLFNFITQGVPIKNGDTEYLQDLSMELTLLPNVGIPDINYNHLSFRTATILACATINENILTALGNFPRPRPRILHLSPKGYDDWVKEGRSKKLITKVFLLKIYESKSASSNFKYVIYAFYDNVLFLNRFIIESGLKLSTIYNEKMW